MPHTPPRVLFVELTDNILISELERHAAGQHTTVNNLAQTALRKCAELQLLNRLTNPETLAPDEFGEE